VSAKKPSALSLNEIEGIEKLTLRWLFQAVIDFGMEAHEIFLRSPDDVKDVAEDVTRELLDRLPGFNVQQRIFGTVDYKRARYIITSEQITRQALFVDSKAEKTGRTATIQMSQTSMSVRQRRSRLEVDEKGFLPEISEYSGEEYLTTTALVHYKYLDQEGTGHLLDEVTLAAVPNGKLQDRYNPNVDDNIWLAGRNAPTLGEDFRVRLSFERLKLRKGWRVQRIRYDTSSNECVGVWDQ
jgi:type II restriction enzyme SfiI